MRISDWSSDVCSSDLVGDRHRLDASFISQWAEACAAPLHKLLFGRCCLWHEHDIDAEAWHPAMERSKRLAEEVAMRLTDRKSVVQGKSVSVRVDLGGRRIIKKKKIRKEKKKNI